MDKGSKKRRWKGIIWIKEGKKGRRLKGNNKMRKTKRAGIGKQKILKSKNSRIKNR